MDPEVPEGRRRSVENEADLNRRLPSRVEDQEVAGLAGSTLGVPFKGKGPV